MIKTRIILDLPWLTMKVKSEVYFNKVDFLEFGTWLENIKKKTVE